MLDINNQSIADIINPQGDSRYLIICEHASHHIPQQYNNLGLSSTQVQSHIGWDIGAQAVSELLSKLLDAPLILQTHSRLLYDCNRPPDAISAIPEKSEATLIPGNSGLTAAQKSERASNFYFPFHKSISDFLDSKDLKNQILILTIHSFNPVYNGIKRDIDIGIINDIDPRWAAAVTKAAQRIPNLKVAQNQPYSAADGVTHTLQLHGTNRSLPNLMIEIKNNLIDSADGQRQYAQLLAMLMRENLPEAVEQ